MMRKCSKGHLHRRNYCFISGKVQFLVVIALFLFGTVNGLTQSNVIHSSTATTMNASSSDDDTSLSTVPSSSTCWLAIITELDACETNTRMEESYSAIAKAVAEQPDDISLVSIRLKPSDSAHVMERAVELTKRLVRLSENCKDGGKVGVEDQVLPPCPSFKVVCSSDWVEAAVLGGAHGVHVKEHHLSQVPYIRERLTVANSNSPIWIGTSAHSVESALNSYREYQPDYYFVGTCFLTASHPEKTSEADLEGPSLPGTVQQALKVAAKSAPPKVMAIGGIDASNCHIPVELGADGVAVIRAVLQAKDPAKAVADMQSRMKAAVKSSMTTERDLKSATEATHHHE